MNVPVSRPDTFSYMSKIFHTIIIMLLRVVSVYVLWMTSRVKRRKFKKLCKSKLRSLNQNYGASVDSYKFKPDLFPYKCEMLIFPFHNLKIRFCYHHPHIKTLKNCTAIYLLFNPGRYLLKCIHTPN